MKAILYHNYGSPDVLKCEEVEKPTAEDDQVLIKVHAASLNALDSHLRSADVFLIRNVSIGMRHLLVEFNEQFFACTALLRPIYPSRIR